VLVPWAAVAVAPAFLPRDSAAPSPDLATPVAAAVACFPAGAASAEASAFAAPAASAASLARFFVCAGSCLDPAWPRSFRSAVLGLPVALELPELGLTVPLALAPAAAGTGRALAAERGLTARLSPSGILPGSESVVVRAIALWFSSPAEGV
jgi:hypothetical protein